MGTAVRAYLATLVSVVFLVILVQVSVATRDFLAYRVIPVPASADIQALVLAGTVAQAFLAILAFLAFPASPDTREVESPDTLEVAYQAIQDQGFQVTQVSVASAATLAFRVSRVTPVLG